MKYSNIYSSYLIDLFPLIFLEGFDQIENKSKSINWPNNPKFIFTSVSYYCDEVFKLWTAYKQEKGFKYFVGQHGNNWQQTNKINNRETGNIEEIISDKFLSAGESFATNQISGFNLRFPKKNSVRHNPLGKISIMLPPVAFYGYRKSWSEVYWDNFLEYGTWRKRMLSLINSFNPIIKRKIQIKLYDRINELNYHNDYWISNLPSKMICKPNMNIKKYYNSSKIVIICYDSTSILETLCQNIPTIILFDSYMMRQVKREYKEFYYDLYNAGILFTDMNKIYEFLERNHEKIENWWKQESVQNARIKFSNKLSRVKENPMKYLSDLLNKESS